MFDGLDRLPLPPAPVPPRPSPLDTRAIMPLVRAQEAEIAVEMLASAVGANAAATARWLALNWGEWVEIRDPAHPAHAAALDPGSPAWKLAEARDALATACWRLRISTGRDDGISLARRVIEDAYGADVADSALKPLVDAAAECPELDALIAGDMPEPLAPEPAPTPSERRAAIEAIARCMLSEAAMGDLDARLAALLAAMEADAGDRRGQRTADAIKAVRGAVEAALRQGVDMETMQAALDRWAEATGGPEIVLNANPD
jgi:hypothetical protein